MEITEIRIKLMNDPNERLQAFCSLTFDGSFVIRDLKIGEIQNRSCLRQVRTTGCYRRPAPHLFGYGQRNVLFVR